MSTPVPPSNPMELIGGLLDRGYVQATRPTINAITNGVTGGIIETRLNQLEAEAARLAELGETFTAENPVARALMADLETELRRQANLINRAGPGLVENGSNVAGTLTRQLALPGFLDRDLEVMGIRWNVPDPEAVNRAVNYLTSDAWAAELRRYTGGTLDVINNAALRGIIEGRGPLAIAREVRQLTEDLPIARANNLMRTLQLSSYRNATAVHQLANADIADEIIRIATRDDRTCLCCIALSGKRYPVGTVIQDHHQGRCTSVLVVRGRALNVPTGEEWFNGLPERRQLAIAGPGALEALQSGRARMEDFVTTYDDPVFGTMVREASLETAIGRAA